jgi:hypothetical protein
LKNAKTKELGKWDELYKQADRKKKIDKKDIT